MFQDTTTPPWLFLLYQVPPRPSSLRVKVWRRLQAVGAVPLRSAAYLLPNRPEPREDLAWIAAEIRALGGQASLLVGATLDEGGDAALVAEFQAARAAEYRALSKQAQRLLAAESRRGPGAAPAGARERQRLQVEWERLVRISYFDTPDQEETRQMLERVRDRSRTSAGPTVAVKAKTTGFRGKTWVTRPRPGIDRMASAWFIRSHIDPKARFAFARELPKAPAIPFDMYGGEFSHTAGACTLEVLVRRFGTDEPAVDWLCHVVHDVDLRDDRYGEPEAAGVAALVDGLRARFSEDEELLERGIELIATLVRGRAAQAPPQASAPGHRPKRRASARSRGRGRSRSRP